MNKQPTLKETIANIGTSINFMRKTISQHKKHLEQIKEGLTVDEYILQDPFKDIKDFFNVARQNLRTEFQKNCQIFTQETEFLKEQMDEVTQDKLKIVQNSLIVDNKLRELSKDIGCFDQNEYF